MKRVYVVNVGYGEPDPVAVAETRELADRVAELVDGDVEETSVPYYETDDVPEIRTVHWTSVFYRPAKDENGHPLHHRPGTATVTSGSEEGLDAHVSAPEVQVFDSFGGFWEVIATGYPHPETARDAASSRFGQELSRRGQTVRQMD